MSVSGSPQAGSTTAIELSANGDAASNRYKFAPWRKMVMCRNCLIRTCVSLLSASCVFARFVLDSCDESAISFASHPLLFFEHLILFHPTPSSTPSHPPHSIHSIPPHPIHFQCSAASASHSCHCHFCFRSLDFMLKLFWLLARFLTSCQPIVGSLLQP